MDKTDIEAGASYLSIHDVPYRVAAVDGQRVVARCEQGRTSADFEMPLDRFAKSMKCRKPGS